MCCTSPLASGVLLQLYFVVVYDSVVRFWPPPTPLLSIAPLRNFWFAVDALAPREGRLQQRCLLFVRIGFSTLKCLSRCSRAVSTLITKVFIAASDSGQLLCVGDPTSLCLVCGIFCHCGSPVVSNTTVWSAPLRDPLLRPASLGGH